MSQGIDGERFVKEAKSVFRLQTADRQTDIRQKKSFEYVVSVMLSLVSGHFRHYVCIYFPKNSLTIVNFT
jgi:hypothetical protein